MPYEDMEAYHRFCEELLTDLAPETPVERQYAQTFCDTQWRLNRMRSIEDAMLSLGHFEEAGNIDTEHPQVHAALTAARVFRDDSQSFVNISLYEQRLQRTLEKSLKQLQTLQAERKARAAAEDSDCSRGEGADQSQFRPATSSFFQPPKSPSKSPIIRTSTRLRNPKITSIPASNSPPEPKCQALRYNSCG